MRYRDFIQNITITFLALLSLFLFSRTQFFQLGAAAGSGTWQRLTAPVSDQISDAPSSDTLSAPVRAAGTGEYGRYGSISLTTDSESFTPIKTLLREVLGSARSRMDSSAAAFRSALGKPSVYCDFLEPLPVSYLADLMGITAESELSVRTLAAAEQNGQVVLLLWDGGSRYYQCVTAVQPSTLTEVLDHFEHPRNVGEIENADGVGQVGNPKCGDIMKMYLKIDDGVITDVKFKTFGCGSAIATSSMATELIKGKPIEEAMTLTNAAVAEALDGLPAYKMHCSVLAEEAIKAALADYYRRQGRPVPDSRRLPCEDGEHGSCCSCH